MKFKFGLIFLLLAISCQQNSQDFNERTISHDILKNTKDMTFKSQQESADQQTSEKQQQKPKINQTEHDSDHDSKQQQNQQHYHSPSDIEFWQNVGLAIFLTIVGAFCSGIAVGLLSISTLELEMMSMKKDENEAKMAKMILSVVSNHHLFLVTLLIANAMALESLPLVIHSLMPDWAAILFSTFIVLIVAQIIPQSYCTGKYKIILAYYASPIILVMIKIFWVVSYPIAKGLDYLLGVHHHERIQHKDFATFLNEDKFLKNTQKLLLTSTLQLRTQRVEAIMVPSSDFFMLEEKQLITEEVVKQIKAHDYSYVLIYKEKRNKIIGIIKVKQFAIKYLKEEKRQFRADQIMKPNSNLLTVYSDTNLLEMLMLFQAKSTRIALVCNLRRKLDPKIESIMYSKSDMIFNNSSAKDVQVIGVVFLYQLFDQMTKIKSEIERQSRLHSNYKVPEAVQLQMTTLRQPLMK